MELNDLKFGNPIREFLIYLKSENFLDSLLPELTSYAPPPNDSDVAAQELAKLVELTNSFSNDLEAQKRFDSYENFEEFFISQLVNEGISEKDITDLIVSLHQDIVPLCVKIKYHFQRVRPITLALYKKVELYPFNSCYVNSPSYPSGHAFQALVYAEVIGNKYPKFYVPLKNLAIDIANSRIYKGLHYESDVLFANYAASLVCNHPDFKKKYKL